jgi:hypothetical protein
MNLVPENYVVAQPNLITKKTCGRAERRAI